MDKIIVLKPLKKQRWGNFTRYKMCKDTIAPYLSKKGGVETGLSPEVQKDLEEKLNLKAGELGRTSPYWVTYKIDMDDREKYIYLDTPEGELAYHFILGHKRVANSMTERFNWPEAEYVIENVEEEAKQENIKSRRKIEALKRFDSMSIDEMRNLLKLTGKYNPTTTSNEIVEKLVREMAENRYVEFLDLLSDRFFEDRVFIEDLIRIKALRRNGSHVMFGDTPIGHDMETAIHYLNDPVNQPIKLQLKRQLDGTTKAGIEASPKKEKLTEAKTK